MSPNQKGQPSYMTEVSEQKNNEQNNNQNQQNQTQQMEQQNQNQNTEQNTEQNQQTEQTENTEQSEQDRNKPLNSIDEAVDALNDDEAGVNDSQSSNEEDKKVIDIDGETKVSMNELKDGFQKSQEYETKVDELNKEREAVNGVRDGYTKDAAILKNAYSKLAEFLEGLIPAEPDFELVQTDPASYQYQVALRNNALAELGKIHNAAQAVNNQVQHANMNHVEAYRANEHKKLVSAMPMLQDQKQHSAFQDAIKKTAVEFGFSQNEINSTADHRILQLVHYAGLGKQAEHNQKNAKARTAEKPLNGKPPRPATATASPNKDAMKRLIQTGSIEAAMAVDFE